jgi:hypothetical protein
MHNFTLFSRLNSKFVFMTKKNCWTYSAEGEESPYIIIENDDEIWESVIDLQEVLDNAESDDEAKTIEEKLSAGIEFSELEDEWFAWLIENQGEELGADALTCHRWIQPDDEVPVGTFKEPESYPAEVFVTLAGRVYNSIVLAKPVDGEALIIVPDEVKVNIEGFHTEFPEVSIFKAKIEA